jgi:hypothetical protein
MKEEAEKYYKELGLICSIEDNNIMIDAFCIGLKQFYTKILHNILSSNGGLLIMQKDSNSSDFTRNLLLSTCRSLYFYFIY